VAPADINKCSFWKRTLATGLGRLEANCKAAAFEGLEFEDFVLRTFTKRLLIALKLADFIPFELVGSSTKCAL
jgi:hypothetical protein